MRYFIILVFLLSCSKSEKPKVVTTDEPEYVIIEEPKAEEVEEITMAQLKSCLYLSERKAKMCIRVKFEEGGEDLANNCIRIFSRAEYDPDVLSEEIPLRYKNTLLRCQARIKAIEAFCPSCASQE